MTRDDVMRETVAHVRRVGDLMLDAVQVLQRRAVRHDDSKFTPEEFEAFAQETPTLRGLTYGSDQYKAALVRLGPALAHHYRVNPHHPEHHTRGVDQMDLLHLIEMLADWKAATERHADGSLPKSIAGNAKRFGYNDAMARLLARTAANLGWITEQDYQSLPFVEEAAHA
jgi:hypothetical protein